MITWTRKDFRVDWFSGQGAGGQHRNRHKNCCRITHIESGITATGQNHRSRRANQEAAFRVLAGRLLEHYGVAGEQAERVDHRNVVRTYHMERNQVTDGTTTAQVDPVLNGDIDRFVLAALRGERDSRDTGRQ